MKSNSIDLNGEQYQLGVDKVISIGYNTKCKYCITSGKIVEGEGIFLLESGGIKIEIMDLGDFYLDTPENRKTMKNKVKSLNN